MIINVGPKATLHEIISESIKSDDAQIEIEIQESAKHILNSANLISIKKILSRHTKNVTFSSPNKSVMDYLGLINADRIEFSIPDIDIAHDFKPTRAGMIPTNGLLQKIKNLLTKNNNTMLAVTDSEDVLDLNTQDGSQDFRSKLAKYKYAFIGIFVVFLTGGLVFASALFIPSATISITIKTDTLIKLIEVKASKDYQMDINERKIPAIEVTATETETLTAKATGKKLIGEKAKGKIKFVNKTDEDIKIKKDDEIKLISTDKENLKYKITSETSIPKATEDTSVTPAVKTYGEKEVSIEALNIGDDYNVKEDQKFELEDYDTDEIVGENGEKFSGGKEEEKTTVSQTDLDDLRKNLEVTIKEKVGNSIKRKLINSQEIIEQALKFDITTASYNKKLDEEATDVTLSITMTGTTYAFSKDDLDKVVKESAKAVVPESFILDIDNIKYETAATYDQIAKVVNIQVKLKSSITPNIDKEKIKSELAGKEIKYAQEYLDKLKNLDQYDIEFAPRLPGPLLRMPYRKENITMIVNK